MHRVLLSLFLGIVAAGGVRVVAAADQAQARAVKITVLSTMLADGSELGEWGFAALVEVDGRRILFDTGAKTDVVLKNLQTMKLDLADVTDVVLSHWHWDHNGGFMTLRRDAATRNPRALSRAHVGRGFFDSRFGTPANVEQNRMIAVRPEYESGGGTFVVHDRPVELQPGVWLSGPVPRRHPERNWSGSTRVRTAAGVKEDTIDDDMALVIDTAQGLVVITGCGHAGVINILEQARAMVRPAPVHALVGGIHLFNATDETLTWTAGKLREFGLGHFIGAHCTGLETVYRFRRDVGLGRAECVVGAVGATFELGRGIGPGAIAR